MEWSVSLPYNIVNSMRAQFSNSKILLDPGCTFGLHSCAEGLMKERGIDVYHKPIGNGITKVWQWVGEEKVYLMKRD